MLYECKLDAFSRGPGYSQGQMQPPAFLSMQVFSIKVLSHPDPPVPQVMPKAELGSQTQLAWHSEGVSEPFEHSRMTGLGFGPEVMQKRPH